MPVNVDFSVKCDQVIRGKSGLFVDFPIVHIYNIQKEIELQKLRYVSAMLLDALLADDYKSSNL